MLKGEPARDNAERLALALARHAYDTRRFIAAARLWAEALDEDPTLAASRQTQHAYNAACAAALAAEGQGTNAPDDDTSRTDHRGRALGWLREELDIWAALLASADELQRTAIAATLQHWQNDSDLASIRDPDPLSHLPEAERTAFKQLWQDVADLIANTDSSTSPELSGGH